MVHSTELRGGGNTLGDTERGGEERGGKPKVGGTTSTWDPPTANHGEEKVVGFTESL